MHVKTLLFIAAFALVSACSSNKKLDENLTETELYQQAQTDLEKENFSSATKKLKALETRYPFGRYAEQAQLDLIYAQYKSSEPEAARASADRFMRLNPANPNVDYALYIKGLTSFEQDRGILSRFLPLDMTKRDPGSARDSYNQFAQLTSRYPNSQYAPDAKQRMIYLRNLLAAQEAYVGYYYLKREAYVASLNRGQYIVENFQGTPAVADGLALMTESYQHLTLNDLAANSLATLKLNYPDHPSLASGEFKPLVKEEETRNWLSKATLGLIDSKHDTRPVQTQASKDMLNQYQDAVDALPPELYSEDMELQKPKRSWLNRLTFGLFK
ncbi:outer membrane protein assembly factor BamD [Thiopseudomonas alkaliphila]|uniref:Outer membrane protein assembly factor BamD n=1 Tax=Thiopseudomonas alkaliphila TaxID=1697053 RepID=A0AAW7DNY1_9GAMM|nr:outer membrane protein assembly factor BamD [Thiopseudomonas alkaliphila]MDM1695865.1 outer membrane protein assembly factor BamD [Thiopseudomonas alkaliphila]MDM1716430.1 outer membrane protein assembly factor BamD [Thiopseudomonas alkaliphila]